MEQKKLTELKANETFEGFVMIRSFVVKTGQSGRNYLDLTITDPSGEMNAKYWNYSETQFENYHTNMLIKVRGTATLWQNAMQLRIERVRPANDSDPVSLEDFVPSAPKSGMEMMRTLEDYIARIEKRDLHDIVVYIIGQVREKLLYYPAAQSNHHSVRGGLLYHTTTMLAAADAMCKIYTELDSDYLFAGCILHDIEKTEELDSSELGLVKDYTMKGLLLGHVVQGPLRIAEAGRAVGADDQTVILLQHMLISHHYEPEFGAVKRPMFPEAEMLHYLDMIDARMFDFRKALAEVDEGGFTERQWRLDNRRLYKKIEEKE
ncbi:MAG: TraI domain-containing protein [Clostridia bacterium]|nr:TraI domain-containing protein [Clostridia bacterium]